MNQNQDVILNEKLVADNNIEEDSHSPPTINVSHTSGLLIETKPKFVTPVLEKPKDEATKKLEKEN